MYTSLAVENKKISFPYMKNKVAMLNIIPIKNNHNVSEIICVVRDITEEEKMNEDLLNLNDAISLANQFIWCGTRRKDNSYKYTYLSPHLYEIFGLNKTDLLKDSRSWIKHVHADDKHKVLEYLEKKKVELKLQSEIKYRYNHPIKNKVIWLHHEARYDPTNKKRDYGYVKDITETIESIRKLEITVSPQKVVVVQGFCMRLFLNFHNHILTLYIV